MTAAALDCLIVGGGPAGLTAAIYLARFHLAVAVVDAGRSRAASIPLTRNHAGYPEGIAGRDLIVRMRDQAARYGTRIEAQEVTGLMRRDDMFAAATATGEIAARTVLLATGVVNRRPEMDEALHDDAVARGLLRYCPICDGYEVTDTRVAVIGTSERGMNEALFLRGYTADVTLIAPGSAHELDTAGRALLTDANVRLVDGPVAAFALDGDTIRLRTAAGPLAFASIYPALGSDIRSELAVAVGADASDEGCLLVDEHQRTTIPGLYAAGDVVKGLDQISHAMGEGGVAATAIRNDLARARPLYRDADTQPMRRGA